MKASDFEQLAVQAQRLPVWPNDRFPPSLYYRFLRVLAANMKPRLSVELGVCGGGASLHLCAGHPGGMVVGVECAAGSDWEQANWKIIKRHFPNWVLWKGDSIADAPCIAKEYGTVDILFIDTTHTYEQTVAEWEAWEPFMAERAVICLDDLFRPEMDGVWDWAPWENKLRLDRLHDGAEFGGGFGVVWR